MWKKMLVGTWFPSFFNTRYMQDSTWYVQIQKYCMYTANPLGLGSDENGTILGKNQDCSVNISELIRCMPNCIDIILGDLAGIFQTAVGHGHLLPINS